MKMEKELLKYYYLVDEYGEVLAAFESYDKALKRKSPTDEIRYFDGHNTIFNVVSQWGEK
jgi:hypothetical protein